MSIPKIIHHVWTSGDAFKQKFWGWRSSWMFHNPSFTMVFWTLENLPYDLMTKEGVSIIKSNLCYVSKSDIVRGELLYLFGGIYADTDIKCIKSFEPLLNTKAFASKGYCEDKICNAVIGSEPGHPVIKEMVDAIPKILEEKQVRAEVIKKKYIATNSVVVPHSSIIRLKEKYNELINSWQNEIGKETEKSIQKKIGQLDESDVKECKIIQTLEKKLEIMENLQ